MNPARASHAVRIRRRARSWRWPVAVNGLRAGSVNAPSARVRERPMAEAVAVHALAARIGERPMAEAVAVHAPSARTVKACTGARRRRARRHRPGRSTHRHRLGRSPPHRHRLGRSPPTATDSGEARSPPPTRAKPAHRPARATGAASTVTATATTLPSQCCPPPARELLQSSCVLGSHRKRKKPRSFLRGFRLRGGDSHAVPRVSAATERGSNLGEAPMTDDDTEQGRGWCPPR